MTTPHDVVVEDYTAFSPCFSFFFTRKPVIGSFQNLHSQKAAKGKGLFKALSADLFDAIALRNFRHLTAVSPDLTAILQKRAKFTNNIRFIGVGIDQALFEIDRGAKSAAPYILYIGRIELYQKGIDILLAAFEKLPSPRPRLVLAGSGVDMKKAEEMVRAAGMEKGVRFTGRFSNEEKFTLLRDAAFVVMPSRFEGYPVVPLEAMASGNAVIGTDIPGTRDVVGDCGVIVPPDDANALHGAMQRLLTDAAHRSALELKGRDHARQFEWSSIAGQFHDFITHSMALHASAETARQ
jgi:glycosyltransferase involved in cell wall biosynthesis